jgi:23S rRNA (adenine2503-C2)-methyltransferase
VAGRYDLSDDDLATLLAGEPPYRVRQVRTAIDAGRLPEEMTDLPAVLRERLAVAAPPALRALDRREADGGETVKWLWALDGGGRVETVLMRYPDRVTVCVSSQAGCAMGCRFCATGQGGFDRHLTAGEIVEQVVAAGREAAAGGRRLSNVVFMGMGEPLANYDRVWSAVVRLQGVMGMSARRLTISTVGLVPGIRRLAGEALPVNLAVSLHAANDTLRDQLVPINRRWPLGRLMEACAEYRAAKRRRLSFEWAVIDGVNDSGADVRQLAALARPLGAHVNLIPLNPTPGYPFRGAPLATVRRMADDLGELGVNATIRANRGTDIAAACGQLAAGAVAVGAPGGRRSGMGPAGAELGVAGGAVVG